MTTTRDSQLPLAAHQAQAFAAVRLLPRPPWDGLQASAARGIGSLLPDLIGGQARGPKAPAAVDLPQIREWTGRCGPTQDHSAAVPTSLSLSTGAVFLAISCAGDSHKFELTADLAALVRLM